MLYNGTYKSNGKLQFNGFFKKEDNIEQFQKSLTNAQVTMLLISLIGQQH